jgi:hypothetical protein
LRLRKATQSTSKALFDHSFKPYMYGVFIYAVYIRIRFWPTLHIYTHVHAHAHTCTHLCNDVNAPRSVHTHIKREGNKIALYASTDCTKVAIVFYIQAAWHLSTSKWLWLGAEVGERDFVFFVPERCRSLWQCVNCSMKQKGSCLIKWPNVSLQIGTI